MLPYVILQNAVSADGRIEGFAADIGLFYKLVGRLQADAHLVGCDTLMGFAEGVASEEAVDLEPPPLNHHDSRPLLVVPDSRGRLHNWNSLLESGYWRAGVALCSRATSAQYLEYLKAHGIDAIVAGDHQVDLPSALHQLKTGYRVERVYVDSGGTLNGVLLRAGLVDEVNLLIHPVLVGGTSPRSMYRAPDLALAEAPTPLYLSDVERLGNGLVWLRYKVNKPTQA